ncbi:hypothetical protein Tco_0600190 [Tanacetum coccineum]|uniref:Uncharacterized protein n=1 Tax=Tanacetum coccineum TaxID=301880 RepID=A0ABQ4WB39_9ASTR
MSILSHHTVHTHAKYKCLSLHTILLHTVHTRVIIICSTKSERLFRVPSGPKYAGNGSTSGITKYRIQRRLILGGVEKEEVAQAPPPPPNENFVEPRVLDAPNTTGDVVAEGVDVVDAPKLYVVPNLEDFTGSQVDPNMKLDDVLIVEAKDEKGKVPEIEDRMEVVPEPNRKGTKSVTTTCVFA